jgi:hypothetical protein
MIPRSFRYRLINSLCNLLAGLGSDQLPPTLGLSQLQIIELKERVLGEHLVSLAPLQEVLICYNERHLEDMAELAFRVRLHTKCAFP